MNFAFWRDWDRRAYTLKMKLIVVANHHREVGYFFLGKMKGLHEAGLYDVVGAA